MKGDDVIRLVPPGRRAPPPTLLLLYLFAFAVIAMLMTGKWLHHRFTHLCVEPAKITTENVPFHTAPQFCIHSMTTQWKGRTFSICEVARSAD